MNKYKVLKTASSIYDIPIEFYKTHGIKYLLLDIDNTLDSYKKHIPSDRSQDLISNFKTNDIKVLLMSNNNRKRVSCYAQELNVPYIGPALKPNPKKINLFLALNKWNKEECLIIGDQYMTDVKAGYRTNIKVIKTEKIVKEDQFATKINRIFERIVLKYLNKHNLLKDYKED